MEPWARGRMGPGVSVVAPGGGGGGGGGGPWSRVVQRQVMLGVSPLCCQ